MNNFNEITPPTKIYWKFKLGEHPEILHIIKTGYEDLYIRVWEDGYGMLDDTVEYLTKDRIKEKYNIEL